MEAATDPNNTNHFPNSLPLHIYKSILLFITLIIYSIKKTDRKLSAYFISETKKDSH